MVHDGPAHVWIKFGLLGVALYFLCYWFLLRRLWRNIRDFRSPVARGLTTAGFAFFVAQLAATLTVFPWPFEQWATAVLFGMVLGLVFLLPSFGSLDDPRECSYSIT